MNWIIQQMPYWAERQIICRDANWMEVERWCRDNCCGRWHVGDAWPDDAHPCLMIWLADDTDMAPHEAHL
jgi:hypothetical protein